MDVYIGGKRVRLNPTHAVGKGGEADVFRLDSQTVVKVFKRPNHPDFNGNPIEVQGARTRIDEHQRKLREFPKNLPEKVISPQLLATDRTGDRILGYTMRFLDGAEVLLRFSERSFRQRGADNNEVTTIFLGLHPTLQAVHQAGVVLGDFNDLNILVKDKTAFIIDADSAQYGEYLCRVYTERFVDPLHCDQKATRPILVKPHTAKTDWYAYSVMLFRSLLLCDPYGGVYRPGKGDKAIPHAGRPLHGITVFNKLVRYPKPAIPYGTLPDDILNHFHLVFERDLRDAFPIKLLQNFRWTKCNDCGMEHGRSTCPGCKRPAPAAIKQTITIRGNVTSTTMLKCDGQIIFATFQAGKLRWLAHHANHYMREDGGPGMAGPLRRGARYRILKDRTLVGVRNEVVEIPRAPERLFVDSYGQLPVFDANENRRFWVQDGVLMRDGGLGPERIGDVLAGQTLFWVGPHFGFGFYRAGELSVSFVFGEAKGGLNDTVQTPPIQGQLVDSTCFFSHDLCWFMVSFRKGARTMNRCSVIKPDGTVLATAEADDGDGSWLSGIRGKCAAGGFLLAVTPNGIVRVEPDQGTIRETAAFPDTEPFVDEECHLFPGDGGIYVVDRSEIRLIKIG